MVVQAETDANTTANAGRFIFSARVKWLIYIFTPFVDLNWLAITIVKNAMNSGQESRLARLFLRPRGQRSVRGIPTLVLLFFILAQLFPILTG
jgi:hypothetical protein